MKKILIILSLTAAFLATSFLTTAYAGNVKGRVMCEGRPVEGVRISDGYVFATTGRDGRYDMQSEKRAETVFIIIPGGYTVPLKDGLRPDFWQKLNLPVDKEEIHDFQLIPQKQDNYRVILPADVHLANDPRRDDINRFLANTLPLIKRLHAEGLEKGPVLNVDLGDLTHDFYWGQFGFRDMEALSFYQDNGYPGPLYAVAGNHDHDPSVVGENVDWRAGWMQRECWGPDHYSMNIGLDHWIFMDNMFYVNNEGKGRLAPGVKGDRSCPGMFREEQLAWLVGDLSALSPDTRVFMCCHGPLIYANGKKAYGLPEEQIMLIDNLASNFTHGLTVYAGHWHRWEVGVSGDYPHIVSHSLGSAAGDLWETLRDWKITGSDGSDAGVAYVDCAVGEEPILKNESYSYGPTAYRVYDCNELKKAYLAEMDTIEPYLVKYPQITDYTSSEWKNVVLVNYWRQQPGDVVELYENGKKVKGYSTKASEPTKYFAWDVQVYHGRIAKGAHKSCSVPYMWEFKTKSAKTPVTLIIKDRDGKEKYRETFQRPILFDPSGKAVL